MDTSVYENFLTALRSYQEMQPCPVLQSLEILQGKWSAKIIFHLLKNGNMRFSNLKKAVPTITNTMLTATLKDLVEQDIVLRKQYNEMPLRVEYSLTSKGNALLPVFCELGHWWKTHSD